MLIRRISQVLLWCEMLAQNFACLLWVHVKSENFRGTGGKTSRLFMVKKRYRNPLSTKKWTAGKYKRMNKQKAILSEPLEDPPEFLLPSAFVPRLVWNLLSQQPQQHDTATRGELAHQEGKEFYWLLAGSFQLYFFISRLG